MDRTLPTISSLTITSYKSSPTPPKPEPKNPPNIEIIGEKRER